MGKIFEDEFMEIQEGLIALCMEVTDGKVDKIFAYCSIEKKTLMFNAFFMVDGEIKMLRQLGIKPPFSTQFLREGTNDLKKFRELGNVYDMPIPTEIKMCYEVATNKLEAKYRYEEVASANLGTCAEDVFMKWMDEEKENL